jgi:hypothetical protein
MNGVGHLHVKPDGTLSGKAGVQVRVAVRGAPDHVQIASATYGEHAIRPHRESELMFTIQPGPLALAMMLTTSSVNPTISLDEIGSDGSRSHLIEREYTSDDALLAVVVVGIANGVDNQPRGCMWAVSLIIVGVLLFLWLRAC